MSFSRALFALNACLFLILKLAFLLLLFVYYDVCMLCNCSFISKLELAFFSLSLVIALAVAAVFVTVPPVAPFVILTHCILLLMLLLLVVVVVVIAFVVVVVVCMFVFF